MEITKTFYAPSRKEWRAWLKKNYKTEKDIWLVYFNKASGRKRIPYNHAVEEALCFGWIDSTAKKIDHEKFCQRFSPRNPKSVMSEMNKERVRRLIRQKKMTKFGMEKIKRHHDSINEKNYQIPEWVVKELKKDLEVWKNFQRFSDSYKRIRIGWIVMSSRKETVSCRGSSR